MQTLARLVGGIGVGILAWIIMLSHDGPDDAIPRMIFGMIVAAVFSVAMLILGLPLRLAFMADVWQQLRPAFVFALSIGAMILLFPDHLGLTHPEPDPDNGGTIRVFNSPGLLLLAYILLVFPIVNWPRPLQMK